MLGGLERRESAVIQLGLDVLLAFGLSFVAGLISIAVMMHWLSRVGFTPFVIYRILLGGALLYWIYA